MQNKTTTTPEIPQHLIAGIDLRNPNDVEFIGVRKNKTVLFLQGGQVKPFSSLRREYFNLLLDCLNDDEGALLFFSNHENKTGEKLSIDRIVEIYTYYMWGDLDHTPDIITGVLQPSENFRDTFNCPSIEFTNKQFTIDGETLNKRDLIIIDMSARECLDFEIASVLDIRESTLDGYKTKLLKRTGCASKLGLVIKSYQNHLSIA